MSSGHMGSTHPTAPTSLSEGLIPTMLGEGVVSCPPCPCSSTVSASGTASFNAPASLLTQGLCTDRSLCLEHPSVGYVYGSFRSLLEITPRQTPSWT